MATNEKANAKDAGWTSDDDLKLIFTCLLNSQGQDLKINGWSNIEKMYNGMPGSDFTKAAMVQRYNRLKKDYVKNYLDKLPTSSDNGEGSSATQTGGKRKASAAVDNAAENVEKPGKKSRKLREKNAKRLIGGNVDESEHVELGAQDDDADEADDI